MRQPIRPFIIAYKNRATKSRTSNSRNISDPQSANTNPSLDDPSIFATREIKHDAAYLAALEAADTIFGGKAAELPEFITPPKDIPGRVLPNLLQEDALSIFPARGASIKTDRVRQPARVAKSVLTKPNKSTRQAAAATTPTAVQQVIESTLEVVPASSQRARRAIQKKWVLKTELKAGEKWKRRLSKAAR
jgi:hypothetical protein